MARNTPTASFLLIVVGFILLHIPACFCEDDQRYVACGKAFRCANIENISYPFWGGERPDYCGYPGFELDCNSEDAPVISIQSTKYKVVCIDSSERRITVARQDLERDICLTNPQNSNLDFSLFNYVSDDINITIFYDCSFVPKVIPLPNSNRFNCSSSTKTFGFYLVGDVEIPPGITCDSHIMATVNQTGARVLASHTGDPRQVLRATLASGFSLQWTADNAFCDRCTQSGGRCGSSSNQPSTPFACYCADGSHSIFCNDKNSSGLGIAGAVLAGIGIGWIMFFYRQRRKQQAHQPPPTDLPVPSSNGPSDPSTSSTTNIPSYHSSRSQTVFGTESSYFGAQLFSYAELQDATDNFDQSRELGDGGFGTVYYGELQDGREVAVKRLYENNFKRVEQFMNEVEILTKLRHKNLVTLYGCTSKQSRDLLLVYEYIPNGTVADHLHGKRAKSGMLSWSIRLNIAIETAEALAYLHRSDIIHRDVKTNNILLDNDFHVKVADFGLSRLFPNDVTHVSTAPQGTPGYVDPEYYQVYQLTEKSDVYSFGVVLVELISSLQAVDTSRHRHDINLANMALNKVQNDTLHELVDQNLGFTTNSSVRRMTTQVAQLAFRCLQGERDMRPSMQEVVDALKGLQDEELNPDKVEVLDIVVQGGGVALKSNATPPSSDSSVTDKGIGSSTTSCSW
ncbi:PREDICTED: LEAF RUST 10 DISEASE-RESISTANCE LOCUS RECEPTOR-LIKE PROTEIN KINASE-like 1.4 [Ipomoea nil]|uniref:LEAF RUST 10 DISEASE-RESISTANCE LOCUS RECEPTOR-LIKE PROTEIN KINASE-like 1.4 n=1 Tax=Ipomoea nil TaxID=35883 RepID=UPI000900EBC0|nr:PREDICTED: LEAF RUST 10 DISEASE-RESISTANCE LOCUS RECEPTOR-LIKE PROTEIN KINASE-like 1.4 [Ipomoea nil]